MISAITYLDNQVLIGLFSARTTAMVSAMTYVSMFGEWTLILPLAAAVALVLFFAKHRAEALGLLVAVFGSTAVVLALKFVFARERPDAYFRAIAETGASFPSAHAALSLAFYGFVAYLILRRYEGGGVRLLAVGGAAALALAIGFSRLYLGVHYLSDVVDGFAIGAIFLWLGIAVARHVRNRAAS
ncbi:MAG TPA: phosphatase PAP2 family protein [Candidatus Paceibacterota bacterium]